MSSARYRDITNLAAAGCRAKARIIFTLICSDGEQLPMDEWAARQCSYSRSAIDDGKSEKAVPFDAAVVRCVLSLVAKLAHSVAACECLLDGLQMVSLLETTACVFFLGYPSLQARVAQRTDRIFFAAYSSPASVRAAFRIAADLAPAEEEAALAEPLFAPGLRAHGEGGELSYSSDVAYEPAMGCAHASWPIPTACIAGSLYRRVAVRDAGTWASRRAATKRQLFPRQTAAMTRMSPARAPSRRRWARNPRLRVACCTFACPRCACSRACRERGGGGCVRACSLQSGGRCRSSPGSVLDEHVIGSRCTRSGALGWHEPHVTRCGAQVASRDESLTVGGHLSSGLHDGVMLPDMSIGEVHPARAKPAIT